MKFMFLTHTANTKNLLYCYRLLNQNGLLSSKDRRTGQFISENFMYKETVPMYLIETIYSPEG
jgi:hypothetical protein